MRTRKRAASNFSGEVMTTVVKLPRTYSVTANVIFELWRGTRRYGNKQNAHRKVNCTAIDGSVQRRAYNLYISTYSYSKARLYIHYTPLGYS
jgi:hypothetical protein